MMRIEEKNRLITRLLRCFSNTCKEEYRKQRGSEMISKKIVSQESRIA